MPSGLAQRTAGARVAGPWAPAGRRSRGVRLRRQPAVADPGALFEVAPAYRAYGRPGCWGCQWARTPTGAAARAAPAPARLPGQCPSALPARAGSPAVQMDPPILPDPYVVQKLRQTTAGQSVSLRGEPSGALCTRSPPAAQRSQNRLAGGNSLLLGTRAAQAFEVIPRPSASRHRRPRPEQPRLQLRMRFRAPTGRSRRHSQDTAVPRRRWRAASQGRSAPAPHQSWRAALRAGPRKALLVQSGGHGHPSRPMQVQGPIGGARESTPRNRRRLYGGTR